jgi:UDP-N-acetylglucosamine 2-epimerase (non-hydrolysing)
VLTCHRPSNVDDEESFTELVHGLIDAAKAYDYTVVFPVHPRTANRMKEYGIVFPERFMLIESL